MTEYEASSLFQVIVDYLQNPSLVDQEAFKEKLGGMTVKLSEWNWDLANEANEADKMEPPYRHILQRILFPEKEYSAFDSDSPVREIGIPLLFLTSVQSPVQSFGMEEGVDRSRVRPRPSSSSSAGGKRSSEFEVGDEVTVFFTSGQPRRAEITAESAAGDFDVKFLDPISSSSSSFSSSSNSSSLQYVLAEAVMTEERRKTLLDLKVFVGLESIFNYYFNEVEKAEVLDILIQKFDENKDIKPDQKEAMVGKFDNGKMSPTFSRKSDAQAPKDFKESFLSELKKGYDNQSKRKSMEQPLYRVGFAQAPELASDSSPALIMRQQMQQGRSSGLDKYEAYNPTASSRAPINLTINGGEMLRDLQYLARFNVAVQKLRLFLTGKDFVLSILQKMIQMSDINLELDSDGRMQVQIDQDYLYLMAKKHFKNFQKGSQNFSGTDLQYIATAMREARDLMPVNFRSWQTFYAQDFSTEFAKSWQGLLVYPDPRQDSETALVSAMVYNITNMLGFETQSRYNTSGYRGSKVTADKSTLKAVSNVFWNPSDEQMFYEQSLDILERLYDRQLKFCAARYNGVIVHKSGYQEGTYPSHVLWMSLRGGREYFANYYYANNSKPPGSEEDEETFVTYLSDMFTFAMLNQTIEITKPRILLDKVWNETKDQINAEFMRKLIIETWGFNRFEMRDQPEIPGQKKDDIVKWLKTVKKTVDENATIFYEYFSGDRWAAAKAFADKLVGMQSELSKKIERQTGVKNFKFDITGISIVLSEEMSTKINDNFNDYFNNDVANYGDFEDMFLENASLIWQYQCLGDGETKKTLECEDHVKKPFDKMMVDGAKEFSLQKNIQTIYPTVSDVRAKNGVFKGVLAAVGGLENDLKDREVSIRQKKLLEWIRKFTDDRTQKGNGALEDGPNNTDFCVFDPVNLLGNPEQKVKKYLELLVRWGGMLSRYLKRVGNNNALFCAEILNKFHECTEIRYRRIDVKLEGMIEKDGKMYPAGFSTKQEKQGFVDAVKRYDMDIASKKKRLKKAKGATEKKKIKSEIEKWSFSRRKILTDCFQQWYSVEKPKFEGKFDTLHFLDFIAKVTILASAGYFEGNPFDGILTVLWKQFRNNVSIYGKDTTLQYEDIEEGVSTYYRMRIPPKVLIKTLSLRRYAFFDRKLCLLDTEGFLFPKHEIKVQTFGADVRQKQTNEIVYDSKATYDMRIRRKQNKSVNTEIAFSSIVSQVWTGKSENLDYERNVSIAPGNHSAAISAADAGQEELLSRAQKKMPADVLSCIGWQVGNGSVNFVGDEWFVVLTNPFGAGSDSVPCFNKHKDIGRATYVTQIETLIEDSGTKLLLPEARGLEKYKRNLKQDLKNLSKPWKLPKLNYCYRLGDFYKILKKYAELPSEQLAGDMIILKNAANAVFKQMPDADKQSLYDLLNSGGKVGSKFVQYLEYSGAAPKPVRFNSKTDDIFGDTGENQDLIKRWSNMDVKDNKYKFGLKLRLQDYVGLVFLVHEALMPPGEVRHLKTDTKKSGVTLALVSKFPNMDRDNIKRFQGEIRSQKTPIEPLTKNSKGKFVTETIQIPGKYNPKTNELYRRLNLPFVETLLNDTDIEEKWAHGRELLANLVSVLVYVACVSKVRIKYVYRDKEFDTLETAKTEALENPKADAVIYEVTQQYVDGDNNTFETITESLRQSANTCINNLQENQNIQTRMKLEILLKRIYDLKSGFVFAEERIPKQKMTVKGKKKKKYKLKELTKSDEDLRKTFKDLVTKLKNLDGIHDLTNRVDAILNKATADYGDLTPANLTEADQARQSDPKEIVELLQIRQEAKKKPPSAVHTQSLSILDDIICFVQYSPFYKPDLKVLTTALETRDNNKYIESLKIVRALERHVQTYLKSLSDVGQSAEGKTPYKIYSEKVDAFVDGADVAELDDLIKASYTFLYEGTLKTKNSKIKALKKLTKQNKREDALSAIEKLENQEKIRREIIQKLEKRKNPELTRSLPDGYWKGFSFSFDFIPFVVDLSNKSGKSGKSGKSSKSSKSRSPSLSSSSSSGGAAAASSSSNVAKRSSNKQDGRKKKKRKKTPPAPPKPTTISWFLNQISTQSLSDIKDKIVLLNADISLAVDAIKKKEEDRLVRENSSALQGQKLFAVMADIDRMKMDLRLQEDELIRLQVEYAKKEFETVKTNYDLGLVYVQDALDALNKYISEMQEFKQRWFGEGTRGGQSFKTHLSDVTSKYGLNERNKWFLQRDSWNKVYEELLKDHEKLKQQRDALAKIAADRKRKAAAFAIAQAGAKRQKKFVTAFVLDDINGFVGKILSLLEDKLIGRDKKVVVKANLTSVLLVKILDSNPEEYGSFKENLNRIINGILIKICVGRRNNDVWKQVVKQLIDICLQKLAEPLPPGTTYASRVIAQSRQRGGGAQTLEQKLRELLDEEKNAV